MFGEKKRRNERVREGVGRKRGMAQRNVPLKFLGVYFELKAIDTHKRCILPALWRPLAAVSGMRSLLARGILNTQTADHGDIFVGR